MGNIISFLMIGGFVAMVIFVGYHQFGNKDGSSSGSVKKVLGFSSNVPTFDKTPNNAALTDKWTDEDDYMILVAPKSNDVRPFEIDAFEAVISNHRAWSVPDQLPTDRLRFDDAFIACKTAGKRLCYVDEWQTACRGGETAPMFFPKAEAFAKNCDVGRGKTSGVGLQKTDSHLNCRPQGTPLFHIVGNLAEFVQTRDGKSMVVGLTYNDAASSRDKSLLNKACEHVIAEPGEFPRDRYNRGLGFRCCKDVQ